MSVGLRISYDEYARMVEDGAFDALRDKRIELIHGELCSMTPPGPTHSGAVAKLTDWSTEPPVKKIAKARVQDVVAIPELDSAPQPDVFWVKRQFDDHQHPLPSDVLLLIEVADSSLDGDCGEKAELYAAAGIRDYWVVDLPNRVVHVFREPKNDVYSQHTTAGMGDEICPLANPQYPLVISRLLGP